MKFLNIKEVLLVFGVTNRRTTNIINHISYSLLYKVGGVVSSFMLVPLSINFLDTDNYGVWLTISSFISWFSFFDVGLGNGLRNKFAESKTLGDSSVACTYVSTSYVAISVISTVVFLLFFGWNFFIDWTSVFNVDKTLLNDLRLLMPIVFGFFSLQLIFKLVVAIYTADQNHSMQVKIQFVTQLTSLVSIWLLTRFSSSSLLSFGFVFSGLPVLILLLLNFIAFSKKYKKYQPKLSLFQFECLKDIMGLGIRFFIVQLAAIMLFSTDNFIIIRLFGPDEVVPYNIAFKYFSILSIGYSVIIMPFWSSFTEAYALKDFKWIKNSVNKILRIWLLVPFLLFLMIVCSNYFYSFWVGDKVQIPLKLSVSMALFVFLTTFNMIFVNFINGVGKIKLQLITSIVSLCINIPLSIYLAGYLNMGVSGVILATCISLGYSVILRPMQYYKIINNKASGIWNK